MEDAASPTQTFVEVVSVVLGLGFPRGQANPQGEVEGLAEWLGELGGRSR